MFIKKKQKMKLLFPILLMLIYISCKNAERIKPVNFIEKNVVLEDIYSKKVWNNINMFIPREYDTLLVWRDASDCSCCHIHKYRLTNSKSCLIKESGFVKSRYCKDSIDRLTIEYQCIGKDTYTLDTAFLHRYVNNIGDLLNPARYRQNKWKGHKIQNINGQKFIVLDFSEQDISLNRPYEQILAMTISKNTLLRFRFECYQNNCSNFSKKAHEILNSIQIDTL